MSPRYIYEAVGCRFHSEFELPWLIQGEQNASSRDSPSVTVTRADLPRNQETLSSELPLLHQDRAVGYTVYGSRDECYWFYDDVATMRIRDGNEIVVDPADDCRPSSLHQFIIGPGFRTICVQQGKLVLHASAVTIGSTTVAFTGQSGQGKSTTAAAIYTRGHTVIADDLTAVDILDGQACVLPAFPVFKLETRSADELGLASNGDDGWDSRRAIDVSDRFADDPSQLDVVYLVDEGKQFSIEEVPPVERVIALLESSLPLYQESDRDAADKHLTQCGTVAESVQLKRLSRPRDRTRLDELAQFIETDLQN